MIFFLKVGMGGKCWWTYLLQVRLLVVEPVIRYLVEEMEKSVANDLGGSCNVEPRKALNHPGISSYPLLTPLRFTPLVQQMIQK